jgi:hypothetical protein
MSPSNPHFENCQVKVKAEVKENPWNLTYFYVRKVDFRLFFSPQPQPKTQPGFFKVLQS